MASAVLGICLFNSCSQAEDSNVLESPEQKVAQANPTDSEFMEYTRQDYNKPYKNDLLERIVEDFTIDLYGEFSFDSEEQVAIVEMEGHLNEQQLVLKYNILNLEDLSVEELMWMEAFNTNNPSTTAKSVNGEKIELSVNGDHNTEIKILDKPENAVEAAEIGEQVGKFMTTRLDTGDCTEICKATLVISKN